MKEMLGFRPMDELERKRRQKKLEHALDLDYEGFLDEFRSMLVRYCDICGERLDGQDWYLVEISNGESSNREGKAELCSSCKDKVYGFMHSLREEYENEKPM